MIYKIETCSEENKPRLIEFIRKYWKEDHVFVKSDELFRFQHYDAINHNYTFSLCINTLTNEIDGIGGRIPLAQYDPDLAKYNDVWGAILKVRPDVHNDEIGLLGIMLIDLADAYNSHGNIGMSSIAWKLYRLLKKYHMCYLNQYYILNDECTDFHIANIPHDAIGKDKHYSSSSKYELIKIDNIGTITDADIQHNYFPMKSLRYLMNRFQFHPIYKYHFWGVYEGTTLHAILIGRIINVDGHSVIRIMDVYGKLEGLSSIYSEVQKLLKENNAEYLDCLNYGIDPSVFDTMGFNTLDVNGNIIIPNYFEPFLRENVVLNGAYRANFHYTMFKADSDQDRPNIL